jgi:hypothetical protein
MALKDGHKILSEKQVSGRRCMIPTVEINYACMCRFIKLLSYAILSER